MMGNGHGNDSRVCMVPMHMDGWIWDVNKGFRRSFGQPCMYRNRYQRAFNLTLII